MNVKEVVTKVNSSKYWSLYDFESNFNLKCVASDLNIYRHRWFEEATNIYSCDYGYVGVTGVAQCFEECASPVDMNCACYAEEYKPIETVQYVPASKIS